MRQSRYRIMHTPANAMGTSPDGAPVQHREHEAAIGQIRALAKAVAAAPADERAAVGRALYLRYSKFVSENHAHMVEEETEVAGALLTRFSVEELTRMHEALVGGIGQDEMQAFMRVMVPAASFDGRVALLSGARAAMPAPAFEAVLRSFRATLGEQDWRDLASSFAVAA